MKSVLTDIREEGRKQGREQGRKQGRKQGREQGREQGRAEGEAAAIRRLALNMIHDGTYTDEQIARVTELTPDEVNALRAHAA